MKKDQKFLFALLQAVDRRDFNWLEAQPEDSRKEFQPLVAMRWATADNGIMLWLINKRVNRYLFDLGQHPDLSFRLLASCGQKKPQRSRYFPKGLSRSNKALELLAEQHPLANDVELRLVLRQYSRMDFKQLLDDCGIQDPKDYLEAYDKFADQVRL